MGTKFTVPGPSEVGIDFVGGGIEVTIQPIETLVVTARVGAEGVRLVDRRVATTQRRVRGYGDTGAMWGTSQVGRRKVDWGRRLTDKADHQERRFADCVVHPCNRKNDKQQITVMEFRFRHYGVDRQDRRMAKAQRRARGVGREQLPSSGWWRRGAIQGPDGRRSNDKSDHLERRMINSVFHSRCRKGDERRGPISKFISYCMSQDPRIRALERRKS